MLDRLRGRPANTWWHALLVLSFIPGAAWSMLLVLIQPNSLGVHGDLYADAAAAWLQGGNPWLVGPEYALFAGPPTMLLPFIPFAFLPSDVNRIGWVVLDVVVAIWVLRRLELPAYWIAFPPLFGAITEGHIEVLILGALVVGGPLSGLAAVVKPYAAMALLAERRWSALAVAAGVVLATLPFLPWPLFFAQLEQIAATLARQGAGDSVFGNALPMLIGGVAFLSLGRGRALWLAVPLLWPGAQQIYKTMTIPILTPVVAVFWALPIQGSTLVGVVLLALLVQVQRRRALPAWLQLGIEPITPFLRERATEDRAPKLLPA